MYNIDLSGKNKYYSLYKFIRGEILAGRIKAGERLPSKRAAASELGVSAVTVQLAYDQLLAEGYIRSKERNGYFAEKVITPVTALQKTAPRERTAGVVRSDMKQYKTDYVKSNIPAELFPFSVWARLMRRVLSDCGEHLLERVPCGGDDELKRAVSAYLYRARGISANPDYIIIGAGAEHLYGVIVQLIGRKTFAVENPVYSKIPLTYTLNGAKVEYIPVDKSGLCIGALKKSQAAAVHISPSHQFPTGAVIPAPARSEIIRWASEGDRYVIEDDYDSEFRLSGKPLQSIYGLCPDRVIYINTFSKSLAPSMRLGYAVLPPELCEIYYKLFGGSASIVPLFEQKTLAAMLDEGYFERHISRLRNHYRTIRARLTEKFSAMDGCEIFDTGGGLHFIAKFANVNDEQLKTAAKSAGVRIKCLSDYLSEPLNGFEGCAVINYSAVSKI